MAETKPRTVTQYIDAAPQPARERLREIRAILHEVAPGATETLKWGKPVFEMERILFSYAAFRSHLNFMPTRSTLEQFKAELAEYETGRDTVQFRYDEPLPKALIQRMAAHRVRQVVEEGSLWVHRDD
jgi:uncharacterized protein YdhG (YjbR/CyaY superfamily)